MAGYAGYQGYDPERGAVDRKRQLADLLQQRAMETGPKSFAEGISQIGQALIARSAMGDADAAETAYSDNRKKAADMLLKDRIDVIECALIRYFEGPEMHGRSDKEAEVRRQRVREVAQANNLQGFRIDLRLEDAGAYHDLYSRHASASRNHIIDCKLADGNVIVTRVPQKTKP